MRSIFPMLLVAFLGACASSARIVSTDGDLLMSVGDVAEAVRGADVVALGEVHDNEAVHRTHLRLIKALHRERPNLVIAMEMFQRDVQPVIDMYLNGALTEPEFRVRSRPWKNYERDYRPVIEFAKANGIPVLAANPPGALVARVREEGLQVIEGQQYVAREVSMPRDEAYDAFAEAMKEHAGVTEQTIDNYYAAQCVWNATMAETVTDYLQASGSPRDPVLAVLICGRMHSDYGRGAVQGMKERMPDLDVRVLSVEVVDDLSKGVYESPREIADYVIVCGEADKDVQHVAEMAKDPKPAPKTDAQPEEAGETGESGAGDEPAAPVPPAGNPEGRRPALGFMPDYGGSVIEGVGVGPVREGGPADKGGLQEGDVILSINGIPTPDLEIYVEILDMLQIGRNATVRVRRGEAEADYEVMVGSRPAR